MLGTGLVSEFVEQMYAYREYLKQSVTRDLRKRYKRSFLGYLWSMLHPLFMMLILAVVFANIMKSGMKDYAVFLFTGMLPWVYFSSTTQGCLGTIRANASLMDHVSVPKYIFPLSIAWSNLVNFFLSLVPLVLVMLALGRGIPLASLGLPLVLLPMFFFTVGISLLFAVSNVFFEDTQHLVGVAMQALYYLCPVLYSREMLPGWLVPYVTLNPMFGVIEQMRGMYYDGVMPDVQSYCLNLLGSYLVLVLGLWVFKRADEKFIYFV